MKAPIARMALVFCPFPHVGLPDDQRHCTQMLIVRWDGTTEVWNDPPRDFYLNVYDGIDAEKVLRACPQDAWRGSDLGGATR